MSDRWSDLVAVVPLPSIAAVFNYLMDRALERGDEDLNIPGATADQVSRIIHFLDESDWLLYEDDHLMIRPEQREVTMSLARLSGVLLNPHVLDDPVTPAAVRMMRRIGDSGGNSPSLEALDRAERVEVRLMEFLGCRDPDRRCRRVFSSARVAAAVQEDLVLAFGLAAEASDLWASQGRGDLGLIYKFVMEYIEALITAAEPDPDDVADHDRGVWEEIYGSRLEEFLL